MTDKMTDGESGGVSPKNADEIKDVKDIKDAKDVKDISEITAKRTVKDSVFSNLFQDKKYLLQLYQTLHPEDTGATEDSLTNITIENVLVNSIFNDLGFSVGDRFMVLIESQSTWTVNILIRAIIYLAQSYRDYFHKTKQSLYSSRKVTLPEPELYVIYTGDKGNKPDELSLSREFFDGKDIGFEVKAKVIYEHGTEDIINQYILFAQIFDEQRKIYGMTIEAIRETIRICKSRNILREYLTEKETEVADIMMGLYSYEEILDMYVASEKRDARLLGRQEGLKAGMQEGRQEGLKAGRQEGLKAGRQEGLKAGAKENARKTAEIMLRDGTPLEKVAQYLPDLSLEELKEIEANTVQPA